MSQQTERTSPIPVREVVCDLDGTFFNTDHRQHLAEQKKWKEFYDACVDDTPHQAVVETLLALREAGFLIRFWSGRSNHTQAETIRQLQAAGFCQPGSGDDLLMRPTGSFGYDYDLKEEWLNHFYLQHNRVPMIVLEDRKKTIDMYRRHGVVAFQVAEGDF